MNDLFSVAWRMRTIVSRAKPEGRCPARTDRRQGARWQAFCFVDICNIDGSLLIGATVREISKYGAQLRLKSSGILPDRLIVRSQPDLTSNRASVRWISGVSIGVRFDNEVHNRMTHKADGDRLRIVESHLFGKPDS